MEQIRRLGSETDYFKRDIVGGCAELAHKAIAVVIAAFIFAESVPVVESGRRDDPVCFLLR